MGMFRPSLALDHVDRCNTWAALLLLLLALVTWLLPLSPVLVSRAGPSLGSTSSGGPELVTSLPERDSTPRDVRYDAQCWCPPEFTRGMIEYSQAVCASAFNLIMNGGNASDAPAKLYEITWGPGLSDEELSFKPETVQPSPQQDKTVVQKTNPDNKDSTEKQQERQDQKERRDQARHFLQVCTPWVITVLAGCLIVPYMLWSLLASLLGGINVDRTLVSANEGTRVDQVSRRQLHADLARCAKEAAQCQAWRNSALYLGLKLLVLAALLSGAIIVHVDLLPQARDSTSQLQKTASSPATPGSEGGRFSDSATSDKAFNDNTVYPDRLLFCSFQIRMISNVRAFDIQCLFNAVKNPAPPSKSVEPTVLPKTDPSPAPPEESVAPGQVYVYESLYVILLTLLVVLTVANFAGLCVWVAILFVQPCQDKSSGHSDLPLDIRFLVQMARENSGPDFVRALTHSSARRQNEDGEKIELAE